MSEEKPPEDVYREKLKETRLVIKKVHVLMKSKKEEIRLKAADLYLKLTDLELALVEALREKPEPQTRSDRNPLARRSRNGR